MKDINEKLKETIIDCMTTADEVDSKVNSEIESFRDNLESNIAKYSVDNTVLAIGKKLVDMCEEQMKKKDEELAFPEKLAEQGRTIREVVYTDYELDIMPSKTNIDGKYDWGFDDTLNPKYSELCEINESLRTRINALEKRNERLIKHIKNLEESIRSSFSIVYDDSPLDSDGYGYIRYEDM